MKRSFFILSFSLCITLFAQEGTSNQSEIDSIFSQWQNKEVPGVTAGLIYGDNIKYTIASGLADVEEKKKNTAQTKFQIGYVSRQFIVLAALLLEHQGKLSMDDPIQKYLPDFPVYEHTLAISHLINNSSGLNDPAVLKRIMGIQTEDIFSNQDALNLIQRQKKLNFEPGTEFSHMTSKVEILLLIEIIQKASGQSLSAFAATSIFTPLKMNNSLFTEDYNSIVTNIAHSYQTQEDTLKLRKINAGHVLYTSAEDLTKWYSILTGKSASQLSSIIQQLDNPVKLDDGNEFDSWWGKLTLGRSFFHMERGLPAYWQFGRIGGYAANVFRFPEQEMTSFVLGNNNVYNGMPAMLHANHYIEKEYTEPASITVDQIKSRKLSPGSLKKYEGYYWNSKRGIARKIEVVGDSLQYFRLGQERGTYMLPLAEKDKFQLVTEGDEKIIFSFQDIGVNSSYGIVLGESLPDIYHKYSPAEYSNEVLKDFTGSFYSSTLRVGYDFMVTDGQLVGVGPKGNIVVFHPVMPDTFRSDSFEFGSIIFKRNSSGTITRFLIFTDGIQGLPFIKI
nr:serine hydrolase domain-containing protein [uncultured Allomuricauda sp.]